MPKPTTLPAEQPTEQQKLTNHWWFPLGTKLRIKPEWVSAQWPEDHTFEVTEEPYLADEHHDSWTIEVRDLNTGLTSDARVVYFRRVRAGD